MMQRYSRGLLLFSLWRKWAGVFRKWADWRDSRAPGAELVLVLCLQGVTGQDGGRGERGHPGNPVKTNLYISPLSTSLYLCLSSQKIIHNPTKLITLTHVHLLVYTNSIQQMTVLLIFVYQYVFPLKWLITCFVFVSFPAFCFYVVLLFIRASH